MTSLTQASRDGQKTSFDGLHKPKLLPFKDMPKINVDHSSELPASEAFTKIKTFFESDQDIRRLDPKLSCQFQESNMTGKATGSQFKADIAVTSQGSGSKVSVVVDLPLLLSPFKGKVQETIQKKLAKYLA